MTTELMYLALVTTLTAVMWIPYILNLILVRGLMDAVGYPDDPKPMAAWAIRMKAAHYNAVENLVVFAVLVLIATAAGATNECTAAAAAVYFWARIAHAIVHLMGIAYVRTLAFLVGFVALVGVFFEVVT